MRGFLTLCTAFFAAPILAAPAFAAPNVVTDIAPVQSLVATVMGDLGAPALLLPADADPHDFQLRPSQARAVANADLVVWVGAAMSPWLDRAYRGIGTGAAMLTLLEAQETEIRSFGDHETHEHRDGGHAGSGHAGSGHAGSGHEDARHDHSGADPHIWLDPDNAAAWLPLIAAELARLDPENAATYSANALSGQIGIAVTEAEIAAQLAPLADRAFVTFHDAYGYFIGHFGLAFVGSVRMGDAAAPGAAHLSDLRHSLAAGSAACLFPEVNHPAAQAAQLTEGTDTRLGGALDPAGVTLPPGPGLYNQLMRNIAATLADCLSRAER